MPSRAAILFEEIKKSPATLIAQMIVEKRQESDYLEFKAGSKLNERGDKLTEKTAKRYWSQALSGFGNTEGGILIWGVEARKTPSPDDSEVTIDAAIGPDHVPNVVQFAEMLKRVQRDATIDPISGVEIVPVPVNGQAGYVACFVPQGNNPPYRAALDESKNYFQRVGDSFVVLSHSMLRSLFYPRVSPKLSLTVSFEQLPTDDPQTLWGYLLLNNTGRGTARNIRASLIIPDIWEPKSTSRLVDVFKEGRARRQDLYRISMQQDLHPGQYGVMCRILCIAKSPILFTSPRAELNRNQIDKVDFELRVFCADHPEQVFNVEFLTDDINDRLAKDFFPAEND